MEATFKINMVDVCDIQLGNHFNTLVNKYSNIAQTLNPDNFVENQTEFSHSYIEGKQRRYYGIVELLWNSGLIKDNMNIMDLGCGLCSTLYNINLQFKNYKINANFYGVEHNEELLKIFAKYLTPIWGGNIPKFALGDIMDCDLSNYDFILSYKPFQDISKLNDMYNKVFNEMKTGSIFYEYNQKDCGGILDNVMNNHKVEKRLMLFGGERQCLYIKR
jgi:hypothetical protein